jgi:MFS family permease
MAELTTFAELPKRLSRSHRPLFVIWMMFFFQFAAIGVYITYLNVYLRNAGLNGTQIGMINTVSAFIGVISTLASGYISDRTGQAKWLIAGSALGALIMAQLFIFARDFWGYLLISSLTTVMSAPLNTLVDSLTLAVLGDRRDDYGRFRLGGSFGYIIATTAAGFLYDRVGMWMMFPAYGGMLSLFILVTFFLPGASFRREGLSYRKIGTIIHQPAWVLFTVCAFLVWVAVNSGLNFLGVSLQALGSSQSLIGMVSVISAVVEVPFMAFSGKLLRRYGPVTLLMISMSLLIVRFFLLGILPSPGWAIPINMLYGPAFVFYWTSSVVYSSRLAPPELAATAQGLFNSTTNLAGVASGLLAGALFDILGPRHIFWVMSGCCLLALMLFTYGNYRQRKMIPSGAE